jgi:hypothetical protein
MLIKAPATRAYADLGEAWLRYQTTRLAQKYLQAGRHFRLDIEVLLDRAGRTARAARQVETQIAREDTSSNQTRARTRAWPAVSY